MLQIGLKWTDHRLMNLQRDEKAAQVRKYSIKVGKRMLEEDQEALGTRELEFL